MLSVHTRGVGERSGGRKGDGEGGLPVTIKSLLCSIPFDLPGHHFEREDRTTWDEKVTSKRGASSHL